MRFAVQQVKLKGCDTMVWGLEGKQTNETKDSATLQRSTVEGLRVKQIQH
jgi:hypothetical protein